MMDFLNEKQKEFLVRNGLSISREKEGYSLHFTDHSCIGLSEKELKYTINQYISGKYCTYKPTPLSNCSSMSRDD